MDILLLDDYDGLMAFAAFFVAVVVMGASYLWMFRLHEPDVCPEEEELREAVSSASADPNRLEAAIEAAKAAGVSHALVWTANSALVAAWRRGDDDATGQDTGTTDAGQRI